MRVLAEYIKRAAGRHKEMIILAWTVHFDSFPQTSKMTATTTKVLNDTFNLFLMNTKHNYIPVPAKNKQACVNNYGAISNLFTFS